MKTTQKILIKQQQAFAHDFALVWENNPIDNPTAQLTTDDYHTLLRAMIAMPYVMSVTINKRSKEWDYFISKWDTLYASKRTDIPADELMIYCDVLDTIERCWATAKNSPYTYRCVASLIRSLWDC